MNEFRRYSYQWETIAHLGLDVSRPSEAVLRLLDERERACGVPFPAAVREWYALEANLLDQRLYVKGFRHLRPLEELGDPHCTLSPDLEPHQFDLVREGRLPIMLAEYSDYLWAVDLDGSEDPPVSVADDDCVASAAEMPWHPHAASFSDFILGQRWVNASTYRTGAHHPLSIYQLSRNQALSTADLGSLRTRFREGPKTLNMPCGSVATRYIGRGVTFEINDDCTKDNDEDPRECNFGVFERPDVPVRLRTWNINAQSNDALVRFASDLREWGLLDELSHYIPSFGNRELEAILEPIWVRP